MTKKKKVILIISISLLVLIASGFGLAIATKAFGFGPLHGQGFHKRGMPVFMQKEIKSFILWRMDQGIKTLDLSKPQQELYNDFRYKLQESMDNGLKKRLEFKKQAMVEFEKENPDLSIVISQIKSKVETISSILSENLTLLAAFYDSLDNKQQTMIINKIKERINT